MAERKKERVAADKPTEQQQKLTGQAPVSGSARLRDKLEADERVAAAQFASELKADAAAVRSFAAAVDTNVRRLQFLSPSMLAGYGDRPTSRPERLLHDAVTGLLTGLFDVRPGERHPPIPGGGTRPRHLHLSGRASAAAIEDSSRATLIRAYVQAAVDSGDPGQGVEIRYADGSRVTVLLSDAAEPVLASTPAPDSTTTGPFRKNVHEAFLDFRRRMIPYHQGVVGMMQSALDELVGRRGKSIDENRSAALTVNSLADDFGIALLFDRQPVVVRVVPLKGDDAGSFQLRLMGSDPKAVKTSMAFPALVAVSRAALIEGVLNAFSSDDE